MVVNPCNRKRNRKRLYCSRKAQLWTYAQAWRYSKPIIYYSVTLVFPLQTWDKIQFQQQRCPFLSLSHFLPHWVGVSPQGEDGAFYSKSTNLEKKTLSAGSIGDFFPLTIKGVSAPANQKLDWTRKCMFAKRATVKVIWRDRVIQALRGLCRGMCDMGMRCLCWGETVFEIKNLVLVTLSFKF